MNLPGAAFVLDCAMTMIWLFPDEETPESTTLLERLKQDGAVVPALWPLEVANVALVGERRGRVTQEKTREFIRLLRSLPITVEEETPRLAWDAILDLARAQALTVYDAAYLEMALRLGLPLATLDTDLQKAANALGVVVL